MLFDDPNLLSNEEIREELNRLGYSTSIIDSIIEQFWFHDWGNSFISIKNNFNVLLDFLKETKPDEFSRFDFYEYYFHKVLPEFDKFNDAFLKIGMVFELMQTDQIGVEDLNELLKELDSHKELSLQVLQESLLVTVIQSEKNNLVKWIHHTLTEYLASKYILDHKDINKSVEKYMCSSDSGIVMFVPSWVGALRFLVEKTPESLIDWLEINLNSNSDFLNEQLAEVFIFSTSVAIKDAYKIKLFHLVYDSYQEKRWWLPVWAYHNLYKFIDKAIYKDLKAKVEDSDYVHKGNIAATIDGMFKNNHPLLTREEKIFWKKQLISYAKEDNENKVLNRYSLAALENFKGQTDIILEVKNNFECDDSLVREAFINMCRIIDPNSPDSIEFFVKAIANDSSHIYARNALYSINSKAGIETFLCDISDNPKFIHEFLDNESIFNNKDNQADLELIKNITKNISPKVIDLLKKIIISAYTGEGNYNAGKSYFLQQIALLVIAEQSNYLEEFVKTISSLSSDQKQRLFVNDVEAVISVLLRPEDLEKLQKLFNDDLHHHAGYALAEAVRLAPYTGNPKGNEVLRKGVELGITVDPSNHPKHKDYQAEQKERIYQQFQKLLSPPEKDRYSPEVFRYFIENKAFLQVRATPAEKERLLKLATVSNLEKVDPTKIEVRYKDSNSKSGEYTISSVAAYFASVIEVVHELDPKLLQKPENRKKIINFIPFSYLSDFRNFKAILGKVTDSEIKSLNTTMLDKTKDARYLIPQTYIYIAKIYPELKTPKEVLISFIEDPLISENDREYALENLENYISPTDTQNEKLLKKLWQPKTRTRPSDLANGLLVKVFHNEEAIDWRFNILKSSAAQFYRQEGAHSVGDVEMELDTMAFAKPLINLNDERYLDKFIDLLEFSLSIIEKVDYWEYVNYLWRVVIASVVRDRFLLSESSFSNLKGWAEKHKDVANINWFNKRLDSAFEQFISNEKKISTLKRALSLIK